MCWLISTKYAHQMCLPTNSTKCVDELSPRKCEDKVSRWNYITFYLNEISRWDISTKICGWAYLDKNISTKYIDEMRRRTTLTKCVDELSWRNMSINYNDGNALWTISTEFFDEISWRNVSVNYLDESASTTISTKLAHQMCPPTISTKMCQRTVTTKTCLRAI